MPSYRVLSYTVPMLLSVNLTDSSSSTAEDRVDFPDEWREYTLDWRARGNPRQVDIDADAPQRLRKSFHAVREQIEVPLQTLEDPSCAARIRAGIAGEADPFGAGLALALATRVLPGRRTDIERTGVHAWIAAHGIAFAAESIMEMQGNVLYWRHSGAHWKVSVYSRDLRGTVHQSDFVSQLSPLRSVLAALPEREYAEVRDVIGARRTTDAMRFVSAMLMPEQEQWAREACDLHNGLSRAAHGELIWTVASTPELLERSGARWIEPFHCSVEPIARLVDALGGDALPVLVNTLDHEDKPNAEARQLLYEAIGRLPSEAAIAYLLDRLTIPQAMAAARDAARRFPHRTLRAIASAATNATAAARARLAGFANVNGLTAHLDKLDAAERDHLEALLLSSRRHPVAEDAALPQAFATPPWTGFAKPSSKAAVAGPTPPVIDEIRWAPGEQEAWATVSDEVSYWTEQRTWDRIFPREPDSANHAFPEFLAYAEEARARPAFDQWDGTANSVRTETLKVILVRYGELAAPKLQALVKKKPSQREILLPFVNLDVARLAAAAVSRSRTERAFGRAWLDRHAAVAAAFLIPDAVGKDAKLRKAAAGALRHLATADRSSVDEQAAVYGEAAAAAITAMLEADPLDPQVARIPKPGAWADPAMLPQVVLRGGEAALPEAAVRRLMTALAMDDPDRYYPGVDLLAAECDPASLTAFSWGLFELWLSAGSPAKDAWAMDQLRRFADEDTVRRLTALTREWPGENQSRKAVRGLEVLGAIGTDAALRAVHDLSQRAKFKALKQTATEQIEVIADRLDLSLDQLGDRLVPDFGLDADAATVLDYGPRRFTIRFDEGLKPSLVDDAGKARASAPKPNAKDDPELAQAAYERFTLLRKELKAAAADQVKRLESAMVTGRTWSGAEFQTYLVGHPLVRQLAGRLVWQADIDGRWRSFRVAEDRTLADAEDEPFALPEDSRVRVAHPIGLGEELQAWSTVLADYEILQPFDQLARPVFVLDDAERKTGRITRFEGAVVGAGPIVGLLKRGWKYGSPLGAGGGGNVYFAFPEGGYLLLDPSPGVYPGYDPGGDQTLEVCIELPDAHEVEPRTISEALNVVARLTHHA